MEVYSKIEEPNLVCTGILNLKHDFCHVSIRLTIIYLIHNLTWTLLSQNQSTRYFGQIIRSGLLCSFF